MNKEKLLIVVDMQNDFIMGSLGTKEAVNILPGVKKRIEEYEGMVLYTKDTHYENYKETQEGRKLPVPHCMSDTEGWQLADAIPFFPRVDERYLKEIYLKESFGSKDLIDDIVRYENETGILKEVELIGLCSDICVAVNAFSLKAMLPEIIIKVDASLSAGTTPKAHLEALHTMKSCQIDITGE